MNKLWKVFFYEYSRHVLRKRFIFAVLSVPIILGVVMGISIVAALIQSDTRPLGYVDHSGLLANPIQVEETSGLLDRFVELFAYTSEDSVLADI